LDCYDGKGLTAKRVKAALDRHSCSWSHRDRERERDGVCEYVVVVAAIVTFAVIAVNAYKCKKNLRV